MSQSNGQLHATNERDPMNGDFNQCVMTEEFAFRVAKGQPPCALLVRARIANIGVAFPEE